jgi:hypothetical protein
MKEFANNTMPLLPSSIHRGVSGRASFVFCGVKPVALGQEQEDQLPSTLECGSRYFLNQLLNLFLGAPSYTKTRKIGYVSTPISFRLSLINDCVTENFCVHLGLFSLTPISGSV